MKNIVIIALFITSIHSTHCVITEKLATAQTQVAALRKSIKAHGDTHSAHKNCRGNCKVCAKCQRQCVPN